MIDEFKIIDTIIERMNAINRDEFDRNFAEFEVFSYSYHRIRIRRCTRDRRNSRIRFRIRNHFSSEFVNCSSRVDRSDLDDIQQ